MGDRGAVRLRQVMEPGLFLAALALCGWYEAAMAPFRVASSATTFSTGAAVLALGAVRNRRTRPAGYREEVTTKATHTALAHRGAVAWMLAGGLALAVELWELFHSPRSLYPTLSSLANEVVGPGHRLGRTTAFVLWGALGIVIMARTRRQP